MVETNQKISYLFAGQGSQYPGMGKDLYDAFAESKAIFDKADKILGFPITNLCFQGPQEELTKTENCQPAIVTMTIAAYEAYQKVAKSPACPAGRQDRQVTSVNYVAGLSLGEYSALVAAQALSFEDAVYLVRRRGEFMEEEAKKSPGKMASILGLELEKIRDICNQVKTEIANINAPGQVVISGGPEEIEKAKTLAEEQGAKRVILLEVGGAFHSSFMQGAALKLEKELKNTKINKPKIPVICNVTAKPAHSPEEIRDNLVKQVYSSVLWEDSMRFALKEENSNFIEFGPGKVLKGLMRRIDSNATVINIEKKEDIKKE